MPLLTPDELLDVDFGNGWTGKFVHSEKMSFMQYRATADAEPIPDHQHPQEEVWILVEGEMEITVEGTTQVLGPEAWPWSPPTLATLFAPLAKSGRSS